MVPRPKRTSKKNGNSNNEPNEPKFDSAYNRYGVRSGKHRANHACNNGPVDDNAKYGNPTKRNNSAMIRAAGAVPSSGRHASLGMIESRPFSALNRSNETVAAPNTHRCTISCCLRVSHRVPACA
ncbi:MAG: hypothetical protein QM811_22685 [Pirellulales bacterium]